MFETDGADSQRIGFVDEETAESIVRNQFQVYDQFQDKAFRTIQTLIAAAALIGVFNSGWIIDIFDFQRNFEQALDAWFGEPITIIFGLATVVLVVFMLVFFALSNLLLSILYMANVLRRETLQPANIVTKPSDGDSNIFVADANYNQEILSDMEEDMDQAYEGLAKFVSGIIVIVGVSVLISDVSMWSIILITLISFVVTSIAILLFLRAIILVVLSNTLSLAEYFINQIPERVIPYLAFMPVLAFFIFIFSSATIYYLILDCLALVSDLFY